MPETDPKLCPVVSPRESIPPSLISRERLACIFNAGGIVTVLPFKMITLRPAAGIRFVGFTKSVPDGSVVQVDDTFQLPD